jgi:hypothetical protein
MTRVVPEGVVGTVVVSFMVASETGGTETANR